MISDHVPERLTRLVADPGHRLFAYLCNEDEETVVYRGNSEYLLLEMLEEEELGRFKAYAEAAVLLLSLGPVVWMMAAMTAFDWLGPEATVALALVTAATTALPLAALGEVGEVDAVTLNDGGDSA